MSRIHQFLHPLHRRSIWQVIGIYVLAGWVVLQVVDTLTGALRLPEWFTPFAFVLLLIGLPIVLATAFVQYVGTGPSPPVDFSAELKSPTRVSKMFTWKNAIGGGVLAFALWGVIAAVWVTTVGLPTQPAQAAPLTPDLAMRVNANLPTVAVLPLDDLSPAGDFEFFADGIHEDILTSLSKVSGLLVLSRTTVQRYKETEQSVSEIADELGVHALVEGSVRRSGDRVRITAQLIDGQTEAHLWAETYDGDLTDIFQVQSDIALAVADALEAALLPGEVERVRQPKTADLTAYELYILGRQSYSLYEESENERAIQLFKRAISRDATFAEAWAGLANAYAQFVNRWAGPLMWADSAVVSAERAVRLNPESSAAHKALGLALSQTGDLDGAVAAYRRALELDPNNSNAAHNLGVESSILGTGRTAEAVGWYKLANRLSPDALTDGRLAETYAYLGAFDRVQDVVMASLEAHGETPHVVWPTILVAYAEGRTDDALALVREYVALEPRNASFRARAAWIALWAGDLELAESHARDARRLAPTGVLSYKTPATVLGSVALARGDSATARQFFDESVTFLQGYMDRGRLGALARFQMAALAATMGRYDEAFQWLEESTPVVAVEWWLERESAFDPMRSDARFDGVVRQLRANNSEMMQQIRHDERGARD